VDFPESVDFFEIQGAMDRLQGSGYLPVLAHTERYRCLAKHLDWVEEFVNRGGVVQVNASSVAGAWGKHAQKQWKKLFKRGLIHVISTDAHNLTSRPPQMSVCMDFLAKHCSAAGLRELTWDNACRIVNNERL
jgi:protein-tyrosine phosphatase